MASPKVNYRLTATDETKRAVSGAEKRFSKLAKVGVGAVATAAVAAGAALFKLGSDAARANDQIGKLSTQLGISEKALSQYKFIASQTGVEFNTLTMAFQRATRRIAEAAQGTGEAKGALRELNLEAGELNRLSPDKQFEVLAKALSGVESQADKVRLAFKLFDSEGVRLLRTIDAADDNFAGLKQTAADLGVVVDKELTKKAADVNDAWGRTGAAFEGVGNSLLDTFAPGVINAANNVTTLIGRALQLAEALGILDARSKQREIDLLSEKKLGLEKQFANVLLTNDETLYSSVQKNKELDAINVKINENLQKQFALRKDIANMTTADVDEKKVADVTGGGDGENLKGVDKLARLQAELLTEEEAIAASAERRLGIIIANTEQGSDIRASLLNKAHARYLKDQLKFEAKMGKTQAKGLLARLAFEKKTTAEKTKFVFSELAGMTAGVAQHNKTLFKINKVAGIANAVVSAYEGIALTMAKYPYPLNIGMAAAHAVSAFAQIKAIKSTTFEGGGGGTTPSLAATPTVGGSPIQSAPPAEIAPISADPVSSAAAPSVINLSFGGGITDTNAVRDFMQNEMAEALRDGVGLNIDVVTV